MDRISSAQCLDTTPYLSKYSTHDSATPSCIIPIVWTTSFLTFSVQDMSKDERKCSATAVRASFGQRLNQSMVQPAMRAGNLRARLRNFSPTYRGVELVVQFVKEECMWVFFGFFCM